MIQNWIYLKLKIQIQNNLKIKNMLNSYKEKKINKENN